MTGLKDVPPPLTREYDNLMFYTYILKNRQALEEDFVFCHSSVAVHSLNTIMVPFKLCCELVFLSEKAQCEP